MLGRSEHDPRMIRPWNRQSATRLANEVTFRARRDHVLLKKTYLAHWRSGSLSKFHQILRLPRKVTLELHQILRLPQKMTFMIDPRHVWNLICNVRSNRCHLPTPPNTAPAMKSSCHDWSSSHMKRYSQCTEQIYSETNLLSDESILLRI